MKVLILGSEGFIGHALRSYLEERGYEVKGVDSGLRFRAVPDALISPRKDDTKRFSVLQYEKLQNLVDSFKPDAVVHLAEQPSAPYSMKGPKESVETQTNNVGGTLSVLWALRGTGAHLIKLGTAGEYPDWLYQNQQVPEGSRTTVQRNGKDWEIPVPRYAGSYYHFSKVFDSLNCDYAANLWGLNITDINQGVVYGHEYDTRFDYGSVWGTVVHRFVAQALKGVPLTVYGEGEQERGFINLKNALEAIELFLENPADGFRVVHQLTETLSINRIAEIVSEATGAEVNHIENPRAEREDNEFDFEAQTLSHLGLNPVYLEDSIDDLVESIQPYKPDIRIKDETVTWR